MRTMVFDFVKSVVYSVTVDPNRMRSGDDIVPSQPTVGIFVPDLKYRHLYTEVERGTEIRASNLLS